MNMSRWEKIKSRKRVCPNFVTGCVPATPISIPRIFKAVVEDSDVLLHALDARDPEGTRSSAAEKYIRSTYGQEKKIVLVLTKIDLVPKGILNAWISYFRKEGPCIGIQSFGGNMNKTRDLLKLLKNYCRLGGVKTKIRVGIFGIPNVGKSSLINVLKRDRVCRTGAAPGTTVGLQEVSLDSNIRLLDSPGVVLVPDCPFIVEEPKDLIGTAKKVIQMAGIDQVALIYGLKHSDDIENILAIIGEKRGRVLKGGVVDLEASARIVINDLNSGKLRYYKPPPKEYADVCFISVPSSSQSNHIDNQIDNYSSP